MFIGSFGLFATLFLLFLRFVPMVAISEVKGVLPQADPHFYGGHGDGQGDGHGDGHAVEAPRVSEPSTLDPMQASSAGASEN